MDGSLGSILHRKGGELAMIIKEKSMDKVQQMIDEAQTNAKARLLKVDDIMNAIKDAESKLNELGIAKKY